LRNLSHVLVIHTINSLYAYGTIRGINGSSEVFNIIIKLKYIFVLKFFQKDNFFINISLIYLSHHDVFN